MDLDGLALALASVPGAPSEPRPDLPSRIRAHAIPDRALRLAIKAQLARSPTGSYHLVMVRERISTSPPPAPVLTFDVVEDGK